MSIKMVKDLREGTEPISATLNATKVKKVVWLLGPWLYFMSILKVFRSEDLTGEEKTKLALRKLRTCLNFITAR